MLKIGVLTETKPGETRVALSPEHVSSLVEVGHTVFVQSTAGLASGFDTTEYATAGAFVCYGPSDLYSHADLVLKVKEPDETDLLLLRPRHTLFANVHPAGDAPLVSRLLATGATVISAEDCHEFGSSNCVIAGEIGAFHALLYAQAQYGGSGRHFFAHGGVEPLTVVLIGVGQAGLGALRVFTSLGCRVLVVNRDERRRRAVEFANPTANIETFDVEDLPSILPIADIVCNCVLWDKTRTDHLITRPMLADLKRTCVIADVSCDEGGAIETSRATSWSDPTYVVDGIRHFCVSNMPSAVPGTASVCYGDAIWHQVDLLARLGPFAACRENDALMAGLTMAGGLLCHDETIRVQGRFGTPKDMLLSKLEADA